MHKGTKTAKRKSALAEHSRTNTANPGDLGVLRSARGSLSSRGNQVAVKKPPFLSSKEADNRLFLPARIVHHWMKLRTKSGLLSFREWPSLAISELLSSFALRCYGGTRHRDPTKPWAEAGKICMGTPLRPIQIVAPNAFKYSPFDRPFMASLAAPKNGRLSINLLVKQQAEKARQHHAARPRKRPAP